MTSTLHLALIDTLADWEIGFLTAHLTHGGGDVRVATVSLDGGPVTTMGGLRVAADLALADLRPEDSAMLVLPGGETWESGDGDGFVDAARALLGAGVPVAAICGAVWALAVGGLLDDRRHTGNDPGWLAASGYGGAALYVDAPAVSDRGVVTATAVAPAHFAAEVFRTLGSHPEPMVDSWLKLYGDRDPAGFHELMAMAGTEQRA
ncbi:DJ-1/PfpI family protein [Nocardioides sp. CFH 31398]|uniref:DJ-1/PfpI family protein n=1 Tax=Nocardioides sp. CFH 31398 TaxID=2919579 RepID=UPI001F053933|nr:DJ-1/PfpI family protein [Nocardioides sp. CFH 31398]MCH1864965.1 DJ-1/PfpI family protein [Nocardioides sp. CFH 31398]